MRKPFAIALVLFLAFSVVAAPAPLLSEPKEKEIIKGLDGVGVAVFSADGKMLATTAADNSAHLWDVATGKETRPFRGHSAGIEAVALSPDLSRMATSAEQVNGWDVGKGHQTYGIGFGGNAQQKVIRSILYSPDGKWLVCGAGGGLVYLFDATNGIQKMALKAHTKPVTALGFSSDSKFLVSGSEDGEVRLWDATT